jgi:hypothetical protein
MNRESEEIELRSKVLLTFQTALLGMISSSLRGVTVTWSDEAITGRLLFDRDVGIEERECASDIEAEIAAAFPDHGVEVKSVTYNFPRPMNEQGLAAWVYRRKE